MENREKLISIIIPVYNVEPYLSDCLSSLDRQNFADDVEILLLDDGSKDDSLALCEEKARQDKHYRVYHHDNHGVAFTRNRGLQMAMGKYIAWIDPDDYIADDWYASIKECLGKGYDFLCFDYYICDYNTSRTILYDEFSRMISREELFRELAIGDKMQSHLVTKIMTKDYYFGDKTFNNEFSFCEDYEAMVRIAKKAKKIFYLHKPLYIYRQRVGSIVSADGEKRLENRWLYINLTKDRYDTIKSMGVEISDLGCMIANFEFCYWYQILGIKSDLWNLRYQSAVKILKKNIISLMTNSRLSYRNKILLLLVVLGVGGKVNYIRVKIKERLLAIK